MDFRETGYKGWNGCYIWGCSTHCDPHGLGGTCKSRGGEVRHQPERWWSASQVGPAQRKSFWAPWQHVYGEVWKVWKVRMNEMHFFFFFCIHACSYVMSVLLCSREFLRDKAVKTVGLKRSGGICLGGGARGRCRYMYMYEQWLAISIHYNIAILVLLITGES